MTAPIPGEHGGRTAERETVAVVNVRFGEPYDVYIGRGVRSRGLPWSIWANPFKIGPDGDRDEVIEKYRQRLLKYPALLARIGDLRGKVLACWCAPPGGVTVNDPLICHGQVLAGLAAPLPVPHDGRDGATDAAGEEGQG